MKLTHVLVLALAVALCATPAKGFGLPASVDRETWALTVAYLRFSLMQEALKQSAALAGDDPDLAAEIEAFLQRWADGEKQRMRTQLTNVFDKESKARFESFISEFTSAQNSGDKEYLGKIASGLALADPPPADYSDLLARASEQYLAADLKAAGERLGEIQTWVELHATESDVPPLAVWMAQFVSVQKVQTTSPKPASPPPPPPKPKPMTEMERLAAMEQPLGDMAGTEEQVASPMDAFSTMREQKRARALEEAQAGMAQVAAERAAAEQRYSAKKLAAAQADAEAMKEQAEKLASVEKEALEQRQNSWGNRLKRIVGAAVSSTTGAFTGGIGSRAGQEAADALFND